MRLRWLKARFPSATVHSLVVLSILVMLPPRVRGAAPELGFSPPQLRFANVVVGQTETLLVVATNHGESKVTISGLSANNSAFEISQPTLPVVLNPGESLAVTVTFAPTTKGWIGGAINLVSNATNRVLHLPIAGAGVIREGVTVSPRSLAFGDVAVGTSAKLPIVLTNTDWWTVTLSSLQMVGGEFWVSGATFPLTLAPRQQLKLDVIFEPQAVGPVGGSTFVIGPTLNIPLTGIGVSSGPQLSITPAALNFGDVAVGTTEKRTLELNATGGSVTISSVSSSSSQFTVLDAPFPLTVPAGGSASLNVAFTPANSGSPSATLSFASNAVDSSAHAALTGTGTLAFVSLSWVASTSSEVMGYNIYRKASLSGSYTRINSRLDPNTNYTDATVTHGTTYYYATTAVNSKGKESDYSNGVEVAVP
jgi:Abnormal spindle-like microcephaly-assoc'd, ASPM-SPD-2-Hydin